MGRFRRFSVSGQPVEEKCLFILKDACVFSVYLFIVGFLVSWLLFTDADLPGERKLYFSQLPIGRKNISAQETQCCYVTQSYSHEPPKPHRANCAPIVHKYHIGYAQQI